MMARMLADENFPRPTVLKLRELGHDVITLEEIGLANRGLDDEALLEYATKQRRAILTFNRRDFIRLHGTKTHGGIIACTSDRDFLRLASRVDEKARKAGNLHGLLIRIYRPSV